MGELSSDRQALEGAELAPGSQQTLDILRDQSKRPRETSVPIHPELVHHSPQSPFNLEGSRFFRNLRSAKRVAAGGPSGKTVDHLQSLLDHTKDARMFFQVSERLARAQVPPSVRDTVRLGRFTALQNPDGGVRGIVAGDVVRRLVARTMSQQMMEAVQDATAPFQNALATRAGCECIAHALQGITELNPRATMTSLTGSVHTT